MLSELAGCPGTIDRGPGALWFSHQGQEAILSHVVKVPPHTKEHPVLAVCAKGLDGMLEYSSQERMTDPDRLVPYLEHALLHLYDVAHLETSPLVDLLGLRYGIAEEAVVSLRGLLREAIESLRPDSSIPFSRPEWLSYRLLSLTYVESRSRFVVCRELGLSQTTYYRRRKEAIRALAHILPRLCRRYVAESESRDSVGPDLGFSPLSATDEAVKIARAATRESVSMSAVIHEALRLVGALADERGTVIEMDCPQSLPKVHGDPAMLREIVINLLTEGIEAASSGGLRIAARDAGSEAICSVHGVDVERILRKASQPTSAYAVSRGLLSVYGGRIWHGTDETGAPALFFALPVVEPRAILITDDDADTLHLYRRYLQSRGYSIRVAQTVSKAKAHLVEKKPDLILLDVLMPHEDGWDLLHYIKSRSETSDIPVVICSVVHQPSMALALGADKVLCKPIDETTLANVIASILRRERSTR